MRIVIDLDGTLCSLRKKNESYAHVKPNCSVIKKIQLLKDAGHTIIIHSARHMKTCKGDVKLVEQKIGDETRQWLALNRVPYDELYFGKPYGDVYIDDLSYPYQGWEEAALDVFEDELLTILIPMAGRGSRFKEAGFNVPKPLIEVAGEPMIKWAIRTFDSLPKRTKHRFVFIINQYDEALGLGEKLQKLFGTRPITVLTIPYITRGQAETCLAALPYINTYGKLLIHNCDTYVEADLEHLLKRDDLEGALICFSSKKPHLSYAQADEYGYVERTAEKEVISSTASTGLYYFRHGRDFVSAAQDMIARDESTKGEFYVAPCYNYLIRAGRRIGINMAKDYTVFGTPSELEAFVKKLNSNERS